MKKLLLTAAAVFAFGFANAQEFKFGVKAVGIHSRATEKYETLTHDFYVRVVETMIQVTRALDAAPPVR